MTNEKWKPEWRRRCRSYASDFWLCHSFDIRHSSFVILVGHRQTDRSIECFENRVWHKDIEEQFHIKHNDNAGCRPAQHFHPETVGELAHFRLFSREPHQWPDGEAELHA